MKGFLEKGACNDLVNSHMHPFFRKPFIITGCNKCAVQYINSQWLAEWPIRLVGLILQSLGKQHLKVNFSEKGVLVGLQDCVALVNSSKGLLKG